MLLDSIQAFPGVILAMAILALLGPSLVNEILVIGIAWIPAYARITRAQVFSAKNQLYVEAERSLGASSGRILSSHILPNVLAPLLILAAMDLPVVITFEAGLSFLGLGVRPPTPSWGVILSDGFKFVRNSPWPILWAGLALAITTLGLHALRRDAARRARSEAVRDEEGVMAQGVTQGVTPALFEVRDLAIKYHTRDGVLTAIRDVSFDVSRGRDRRGGRRIGMRQEHGGRGRHAPSAAQRRDFGRLHDVPGPGPGAG